MMPLEKALPMPVAAPAAAVRHQILEIRPEGIACKAGEDEVEPFLGVLRHLVELAVDIVQVVALAAGHDIVACPAVQEVVAVAAAQGIVAVAALERIVPRIADDHVVERVSSAG